MGVVLKVCTELVLVGSTLEGEAAAEPASLGGRGCRRAADAIWFVWLFGSAGNDGRGMTRNNAED
jgi:hypothetical protein